MQRNDLFVTFHYLHVLSFMWAATSCTVPFLTVPLLMLLCATTVCFPGSVCHPYVAEYLPLKDLWLHPG
jgi:hypothetical protein